MVNYEYNFPKTIKNYEKLRCICIWAGSLGLIQSFIWLGLTITGILAYKCQIPMTDAMSYGSYLQYVFFDAYFRGSCTPSVYQDYDRTLLNSVDTVLSPTQILIWDCVYLGFDVGWLISSILLLSSVKKDDSQTTVGVISTWVAFTLVICIFDFVLGIIFGIDYGRFHIASYNYNANPINVGAVQADAAQLVLGAVSAIALMFVCFKGFILWIINLGLLIYLIMLTREITSDKDSNDTLFAPSTRKDSDILATRPAIDAYQPERTNGQTNETFVPDYQAVGAIELNEDAIARAARMSTDPSLQDRRFRNLDGFQQYPAPQYGNTKFVRQETVVTAAVGVAPYPNVDYSPQMNRNSNNQNGMMRNQRYQ